MSINDEKNAFEVFNDSSPKGQQQSDRLLFEYEKHYMQLLSNYHDDIDFINNCLKSIRQEECEMTSVLEDLNRHLDEAFVDSEVKNIWLKHLADNISRSFQLSNSLLEHFYIMELEQFKNELQKRLKK